MTALFIAWAVWALLVVSLQGGVRVAGSALAFGRVEINGRPPVVTIADGRPAAFTLGGVVFVTRGLRDLLTDEEQAAVIAHERGHIAHRHTLQRLAWAILLPGVPSGWLSRRHELEADAYAVALVGAEPLASGLAKLPHPPNSRSHPSLAERLAAIHVDSLH